MKRILKTFGVFILLLGILFFYLKSQIAEAQNSSTPIASAANIKQDIEKIIATEKPRNFQNINDLNQVADYIKSEFLKVADSTAEQKYLVDGIEYKNILCSINTNKKERIIIGAHYDVCGDQDGADDNATGVAGMLELARLLKDKNLNYRIDFVAYTLEEPPFFRTENMGSFVHAKYLADNKIPVQGMISLEMLGYYSDEPNSQQYPIPLLRYVYGNKANFITLVQKFGAGKFARKLSKHILYKPSIRTIKFQGPESLTGIDFSDHRNYWKFGYSAMMITNTSFYRNKNYHEATDKIETLNFEKIGLVIDQLYNALLKLK